MSTWKDSGDKISADVYRAGAEELPASDFTGYDRESGHEGQGRVPTDIDPCISWGLAYAPYADLLWMETSKPDRELARQYAEAIKKEFPDQLLAYNC